MKIIIYLYIFKPKTDKVCHGGKGPDILNFAWPNNID